MPDVVGYTTTMQSVVLGGGCFWCLDALYRQIIGVTRVTSGYSGGEFANPTYDAVCTGETGHAEVVEIQFDSTIIPLDVILDIFFLAHDPTTLNRQGNDIGTQYRSLMLYADADQKTAFTVSIKRAQKVWDKPIVTQLAPLTTFYPAEDYHQDYFNKNPGNGYCQVIIAPKILKTRSAYGVWFRN